MTKVNQAHLEKIISVLKKCSFITRHKKEGGFSIYSYGPAGVLTARNLSQLLWNSLVTSQVDTYPVEDPFIFTSSDSKTSERLRNNLSQGTLEHLPDILQLVNYTLPFAIVQRGIVQPKTLPEKWENKFLFDSSIQTSIVLQYFCTPGSTLQSFDQWIQHRLQWWRKYANNPSNISSSDIETLDEGTSRAYIQCQLPWGPDHVEEIINRGDKPVVDLQEKMNCDLQCKNGKKSIIPHVIECNIILEHCLMSSLCDAFTESLVKKGKKSSVKEKLNLNAKVAPYKLSVVSCSKSRSQEIQEVASYINRDLRAAGIDVFQARDTLSADEQFQRNDMMGIPYTVILTEDTLESGVLQLRNKDTSLMEKIHLIQLREIILKNINF